MRLAPAAASISANCSGTAGMSLYACAKRFRDVRSNGALSRSRAGARFAGAQQQRKRSVFCSCELYVIDLKPSLGAECEGLLSKPDRVHLGKVGPRVNASA